MAKKERAFDVVHIAIDDVNKNPNNPRIIKDDKFKKLIKSIEQFPKMLEIRPIVVNEHNIIPCLYGWLDGGSHNWYSDRKQTTIIDFDKPSRNGEHPTMKPVGLFAYQIENSSKIGDLVIDAFGGSGTTMVACEQLKRKARVIEYDPKYCDVIVKRMITLDPNLTIKLNGVDVTHDWK